MCNKCTVISNIEVLVNKIECLTALSDGIVRMSGRHSGLSSVIVCMNCSQLRVRYNFENRELSTEWCTQC